MYEDGRTEQLLPLTFSRTRLLSSQLNAVGYTRGIYIKLSWLKMPHLQRIFTAIFSPLKMTMKIDRSKKQY
jgi:hypothetical protein